MLTCIWNSNQQIKTHSLSPHYCYHIGLQTSHAWPVAIPMTKRGTNSTDKTLPQSWAWHTCANQVVKMLPPLKRPTK